MSSNLKPIKLYSHASGPNPWKVVMFLEQLGLPYEVEYVDMSVSHSEPYTLINPNGRMPSIEDPNTGITLWESGAILQYLAQTYDKDHKYSFESGTQASHLANQWLFYQVSGQGPYYGQAAWFQNFHAEKLPSAIERYQKEVERVVGVIDTHLSRNKLEYLVADKENSKGKFTFADLSFVPWGSATQWLTGRDLFEGGKYPAYKAWLDLVMAQSGVKKGLELKAEAMKQQ